MERMIGKYERMMGECERMTGEYERKANGGTGFSVVISPSVFFDAWLTLLRVSL